MKLSRKQPGTEPGIYYEIETEAPWQHIPSNDRTDAALVFYRFDRSGTNRLEMVVGGFSGRATRCLASYLRNHDGSEFTSEEFTEGLDAGVFIVKFTFHKTNAKKKPKAAYRDGAFSTEVIPLPKEVLASRLAPRRASRSTAKKKTAAKKK